MGIIYNILSLPAGRYPQKKRRICPVFKEDIFENRIHRGREGAGSACPGNDKKWADAKNTFAEVLLYESAEEFLFKNETFSFDAVFLDIGLKKMNGVKLAHAIREKDRRLPIAFLTADREFALEGYEVRAVRYLLKPIGEQKLCALLDELSAGKKESPCVMVEEKGTVRRVEEDRLCYIEVMGHYSLLHLSDGGMLRVRESMEGIFAKLHGKDRFVRCHRSYVVNLSYVEKINRTCCILSDKKELPVSRNCWQELNGQFIRYYMGEQK